MLTLDQARDIVESRAVALTGFERTILKDSLGRILDEDIIAPLDLPREAQSSMDGYAFHSEDLNSDGISQFHVVGTSRAGRPYSSPVEKGRCVRIFTGAYLPRGCDSVVMQEHVRRQGDVIEIPSGAGFKGFVRAKGDEIRSGQMVLGTGKRLGCADLGILASLGIHEVRVRRMPRVAFFSSGDELVALDKSLEVGQIYDSNRYLLYGMLKTLGIEPFDLGVVADDRDAICEALSEAAKRSDAVITSGGASVGEADLIKEALTSLGHIDFWKIAMKPGKPLAFGRIGEAHFFGLPGNPVSVFVTFYQVVRPALLRMMGTRPGKPIRLRAICNTEIEKSPGRQEFQRGSLSFDENGIGLVAPAEKQQSHNLSALAECNCFIVLPAGSRGIAAGETVEVELIDASFHFN